jgi:hypothetical protein
VYFGKGIGQDNVGEVPGPLASAAYEAPAFGSHRVMVVLQNDGNIVQTWFRSDGDVGSRVLGRIAATIDIAAFQDQNGLDHILVLTSDGHIIELTAKSNTAAAPRILGQVPGASLSFANNRSGQKVATPEYVHIGDVGRRVVEWR